jgi:alkylhydroperoxidase/carboxymuconolactone decarboxylase family protein YurZ
VRTRPIRAPRHHHPDPRALADPAQLGALGKLEELEMHVRAALRNGLTVDEIKEVLLQSAIYCGVPAANSAFAVAQSVLADLGHVTPESQQGGHE